MLYSRAHFAVRHAASKDATRYNLNGIHFKADGSTEATDGHMLIQVHAETPPDDEWPDVGDIKASTDALEEFILPLEASERVMRAIPKPTRTSMPVLKHARLDVVETNANGHARFVTTDLDSVTPMQADKIDGEYPNTAQVIPKIGDAKYNFTMDLLKNFHFLLDRVILYRKDLRILNNARTNGNTIWCDGKDRTVLEFSFKERR